MKKNLIEHLIEQRSFKFYENSKKILKKLYEADEFGKIVGQFWNDVD